MFDAGQRETKWKTQSDRDIKIMCSSFMEEKILSAYYIEMKEKSNINKIL